MESARVRSHSGPFSFEFRQKIDYVEGKLYLVLVHSFNELHQFEVPFDGKVDEYTSFYQKDVREAFQTKLVDLFVK